MNLEQSNLSVFFMTGLILGGLVFSVSFSPDLQAHSSDLEVSDVEVAISKEVPPEAIFAYWESKTKEEYRD